MNCSVIYAYSLLRSCYFFSVLLSGHNEEADTKNLFKTYSYEIGQNKHSCVFLSVCRIVQVLKEMLVSAP